MTKKIIKSVLFSTLLLWGLFGSLTAYFVRDKTHLECGKVIDNFTEIKNLKHSTKTEYYLNIQYNRYSKVECVTAETFYENYKIGSDICFTRTDYNGIIDLLKFGGIVIMIGLLLMCVISLFIYLFCEDTLTDAFIWFMWVINQIILKD